MIVSFEAEQMIMPRLSGWHVPRFIAANGIAARPYIVMELVEAFSLEQRLGDAPLKPRKSRR